MSKYVVDWAPQAFGDAVLRTADYRLTFEMELSWSNFKGQRGFRLVYVPTLTIVAEGTMLPAMVRATIEQQEELDATKATIEGLNADHEINDSLN